MKTKTPTQAELVWGTRHKQSLCGAPGKKSHRDPIESHCSNYGRDARSYTSIANQ
jgi:hypothetical protein